MLAVIFIGLTRLFGQRRQDEALTKAARIKAEDEAARIKSEAVIHQLEIAARIKSEADARATVTAARMQAAKIKAERTTAAAEEKARQIESDAQQASEIAQSAPVSQPALRPLSAPDKLQMNCHPENSSPYFVTYNSYTRKVLVTGSRTGRTRPYPVREIQDNTGSGILYVNAKRDDQKRTLFFAFNYSNDGNDGGVRVKGANSDGTNTDARDPCTPVQD